MKSFKPQRGKFTRFISIIVVKLHLKVSNPNGVNLHHAQQLLLDEERIVSNPNGVNLHRAPPPDYLENMLVSNPNGVNLHI